MFVEAPAGEHWISRFGFRAQSPPAIETASLTNHDIPVTLDDPSTLR